jgi:capsular polysaccharide transport system permease protein
LAFVAQWLLIYMTSGIVIQPEILPTFAQKIFSWNPTLHAVEWIRESYFFGYRTVVLDKFYPLEFGVSALFIALFIEKIFRRFLRR